MSGRDDKIYHGSVDSAGRVLLPAALRGQLHLERGSRVVIETDGGSVRLTPLGRVIEEVQDFFCQFKRPGESVADELIRERREEAAREDRE